jgi:hypothetical protein
MALMGYVKVYNGNDKLLDCRQYYSNRAAMEHIKIFMETYQDIEGAYVLVQPEGYLKREHEQKKHLLRVVPVPTKKFERPPAVYDNTDFSLYPK